VRLFHNGWLLFLLPCALLAQNRITAPIDSRRTVVLRGNVHPKAQARFDQGPVEPAFPIGYITLMLKRTAAQQAALEQLLEEQRDPASPSYHDWLTPEQYADRFGLSQNDMDSVSAWLQSEGFTVEYTARGRNWLAFSGTAAQVRTTFHTEIHRYRVDGESHFAAAAEPSVPVSLEPVVAGFLGLDDFYPKPPTHPLPAFTDGSTGAHSLAPGDLATIYDIGKLGLNGSGQSVVVVGQSAINSSDIQAFRTNYNLPAANLTTTLYGSAVSTTSDMTEADIDLEWAGAVAPNAALIYVYGRSADSAAFYAIDNSLAPVISESFGGCEAQVTSLQASSYRSYAQRANLQGITWLVASGDTGAAGCETGRNPTQATQGLAVSFPASVPEVTAVGATEFNEGSASSSYWSTTNGSTGGSAKSYIPEMAWNDTSVGQGLATTGGGASSLYAKPAWQTGVGVPNDGARDLPDISLDGANDHDPYNAYSKGSWGQYGGTSLSTPSFAGIVALLNQYLVQNGIQPKPGVGNINPVLYRLAQSASSAFHDITVGNNIVPCRQGTPNCTNLQLGYSAGKGYDLATGLGSVDVYNLATQWNKIPPTATTTTVTASPAIVTAGVSTRLTAMVKATSGSLTPTGSVSFTLGGISLGAANLSGSGSTAAAPLTIAASQLNAGSNSITASYGGSAGFSASSGSVTVNLTATLPAVNLAAITNAASYATGTVSPGENIVLWGTGIGPAQLTYGSLTAGGALLDTSAGNTSVLFDGVPAPVVYASDQQTSVMVPYEVAGQSFTYVVVQYQGVQSAPLLYNVAAAVPGIYTQNMQGFGPGAILNQDGFTVNGPGAPAAIGSVLAIYMTGEGQTNPAGVTGAIVPVNVQAPWKQPQLTATATVGSLPAAVEYYGSAPGMVSGVMQVNVQIPPGAPSGALPIVVTLSDPAAGVSYDTQARVTVSVR